MVAFVVCGVLIVGFPETGAPGQKLSSPLVHCLRFFCWEISLSLWEISRVFNRGKIKINPNRVDFEKKSISIEVSVSADLYGLVYVKKG